MSLWISGQWDEIGECTMCGAEGVELKVVDEENTVCESCLNDNFFKCSCCGELWLDDPDIRDETEEGEPLCPWCAGG